jgi:hypothetical protein
VVKKLPKLKQLLPLVALLQPLEKKVREKVVLELSINLSSNS